MDNPQFYQMEQKLCTYIETFRSSHLKRIFEDLLNLLYAGIEITERDIEDARNGALRGSEFPGDWMGRPPDDFDDPDEPPLYF
jgi:hypothetical protein